jgi:two-component system, OmpR family, alkaline phosphatase synthesis response regulator PhoP
MKENILLVEDEDDLRITLSDRLHSEGYVVQCAANGEDGFDQATRLPFDLIILDIMLPRRSGLDICNDIRRAGLATPILMLTARSQTADKVLGLKLGADDYLTKPFETLELLARIEALLRRLPARLEKGEILEFGTLRVDLRGTQVYRNGSSVYLSAREFQLLRYLIERRGTTLSRDEILKEVWNYEASTFTRTVDVHVASLRQKLEQDPKRPQWILTVPGLGYRFFN